MLDQAHQHNPDISNAAIWLRKLCVDYPTSPPYWITTPEGDLGVEYCGDCGYFLHRHLRRRDKKRRDDYHLNGGYSTEEDRSCICDICGMALDVSLTDHGIDEEIAHFEECWFTNNIPAMAYELSELCDHLDWTLPNDERVSSLRRIILSFKKHYLLSPKQPATRPST